MTLLLAFLTSSSSDTPLPKPDFGNLPKFEKNFYVEHPHVRARSDRDIDDYRRHHQISSQGRDVPRPVQTFEEGSFPQYVLDVLHGERDHEGKAWGGPTPIQAQSWPIALKGRDCICVAEVNQIFTCCSITDAADRLRQDSWLPPSWNRPH